MPPEETIVAIERVRNGLQAMSAGSVTLTTWALAILGGSLLAVIGSDYLKPTGRAKTLYLLFIPGWILLGLSLYYGDQLSSSYMAAIFTSDQKRLLTIGTNMNSELWKQKTFLWLSLSVFGIWLVAFLLSWIFSDREPSKNAP